MSQLKSPWIAAIVLTGAFSSSVNAGTLVAQIKDRNGNPVVNAVVYALPVGRSAPTVAASTTAIVEQQSFKFEPYVSIVQAGTRMRFPNRDMTEHHLKVLSGPSAFEFKVYTRKEPEPTLLDKVGLVTLQCLIHDWMSAHIYVVDSPWFAKTSRAGSAVIEGVPAGEYDVYIMHPSVLIPGQVTPSGPRRVKMELSNVQVVEAKLELVPKPEPTKRYPPASRYE
ncbi:MAG: methylamine utilization protein [Casimicrobium sp.]